MPAPRPVRFLTIPQVAEELATSEAQINALLKRGDLVAIKLGGRGQWRVERSKLEEFIAGLRGDAAPNVGPVSCLHLGQQHARPVHVLTSEAPGSTGWR